MVCLLRLERLVRYMTSSEAIEKYPKLQDLIEYCENSTSIKFLYLFGSVATGKENSMSDIDLAVMVDKSKIDNQTEFRLNLISDFMRILNRIDIDLVFLDTASLSLRYSVLEEGVLIFERDEYARKVFSFETVRDYLDFEPLAQVHKKALWQLAKEGRIGIPGRRNLKTF